MAIGFRNGKSRETYALATCCTKGAACGQGGIVSRPMGQPVRWRAAVYAGVVAGILATAVEIALWWAFTDALPDILFRDARFAAALVFGRGVLSAPAFDWGVMFIAALVHFALSVVYALILSRLIRRMTLYRSLLAGAAFGLALFSVNMYGFTMVFPWFEAARDWITVAAHLVFGMVAAGVYSVLTQPRRSLSSWTP
jgi:hypothetical protein